MKLMAWASVKVPETAPNLRAGIWALNLSPGHRFHQKPYKHNVYIFFYNCFVKGFPSSTSALFLLHSY